MNPMSTSDGVVDQVLGSAYQVVKYVASNMELLISLGESLDTLEPIYEDIQTVVSIKNQVVNVSDNMSIVSALAAIIPALTNIHNNMPALLKVSTNTDALVALSQNITQLLAVPGQVAEMLSSQDFKNSVVAATTGNITLSGLMSLDGKAIPVNGRVLVKDQTNPVENGIYLAKVTAWVRAADAVGTYLSTGNMVLVDGGNTQAGHIYRLATEGTITPGTTAQVWKDITPNASTLERGLARAATKEEVAAGSSTDLFVSPKELAEYAGLGEKNTLATVGNGTSLVKGKDGTTLQIKALAVGNGLSIVDEGDQVKLVSDVGEAPDLKLYARTSAGWVEIPESSGSLDLSGLDTAGQPITLSNVEVIALNTTQFSVDTGGIVALRQEFIDSLNGGGGGTSGVDSASNMGTGVGIFGSKLGTDLQFRSLKAGAGINIATQGAGEIVISSTVAAGEANTASSLGTGNSIVGTKNGVDLRFKSIKAGTNITISADTNELLISATDTGEVNTLQSEGTGTSLVGSKTGSALGVKSLKAGSNITITDTGDEVTIDATSSGGGSGGVAITGIDTALNPIITPDVATLAFDPADFVLDGDASATQVSLRPNAVVKSAAPAENSGKSLIKSMTDSQLKIKTLVAGSNITITDDPNGDSLVINSTGGGGGGGGLIAFGADAEHNDVEQPDVVWLYFEGPFFSTTPSTDEDGSGISIGLQPDFLKTIPKDRSPVWQNPTTRRIVAGGPALVGLAPAAMSPAITANATWILPFLHTKNWAEIKSIAMQFGGTVPVGSVQLSIQEFPGNPIVGTDGVQPLIWQQTFTYSELASGAAVNLPTIFAPHSGIYLMYIRFLTAAPDMTVKQITSLSAAGNTLTDPLAELMSYTGIAQGSCALTRTYSTFPGTNVPTPIHPFNDGVAVGTTTAPAITLIVETEPSP